MFLAEGQQAEVWVSRDYYSSGVVSVTLTPDAGTATAGADFVADPITLTWADGEAGAKAARIPIVNDTLDEISEDFTVRLSDAAGGAVINPEASRAMVRIWASDQPRADVSGGGGAFGLLSLLLLGLLKTMRWLTAGRNMTERS
jgi:hypothetical protein